MFHGTGATAPQAKFDRLDEVLSVFKGYIKPTGYVAGTEHLTLGDLACMVTIEMIYETGCIDMSKYEPDIKNWMERCKAQIPNYSALCTQAPLRSA